MIQLATKEHCTACGACAFACPKQCIAMKEDNFGVMYPVMDSTNCISCKRCQKVCPILNPPEFRIPRKAYAAWSCDKEERRTSASGGIAAEIYKNSLGNGSLIAGAVQNSDFSVDIQLSDREEYIQKFKNSKYVFSSAYSLFHQVRETLKNGNKVTVIALPCQIAALRNLFRDNENLLLVDVVCHGTTPHDYLVQHIHTLEEEFGQKATRRSFRDPETYTYTFTFTLYNADGQRFCERTIQEGDAYQVGYHSKITYRENCYHCHFAKGQRMGDLTIADYHGLGLCAPCEFSSRNVSLILDNTSKGDILIESLRKGQNIEVYERPLEEPIKGEVQLRHPSTKTPARRDFEKLYKGDFSSTMNKVLKGYYRRERLKEIKINTKKVIKKIVYTILNRK